MTGGGLQAKAHSNITVIVAACMCISVRKSWERALAFVHLQMRSPGVASEKC